MRGFRMAERGPLPPGDRFPEPEGGWLAMAGATEAEARAELPPGDVARMTARGTARRHADRLAGQLAARRAVSALAPGATFHVEREEGGAPFVQGVQDISVSITHADGRALALAVRGARAGIDAEVIAHRGAGFVDTWFTDEERALGEDPATLTRAWAVKEAVLKALGTGMRVHPRDVVVRALREGCAEVRLDGEAATRHAALGGGVLRVRVTTTDALHVVATAILAA
jgi:4'-phosphopantetheinyl transferase